MDNIFPLKPILDQIIVREIPVKDYYRTDDLVGSELLENSNIKILSDRGVVVAAGDCVQMGQVTLPMPVVVGDIVYFDEFCRCNPIYLNPADKNRTDLPKFWKMRAVEVVIDVPNRNRLVDESLARKQAAETAAQITQAAGPVN